MSKSDGDGHFSLTDENVMLIRAAVEEDPHVTLFDLRKET